MESKSLKGRNFKAKYPALAKQWHYDRNGELKPEHCLPASQTVVWWKCKNGHEWQARIYYRIRNPACPKCKREKRSLAKRNPVLAQEWHPRKNGKLTPKDVSLKSGQKVWWQCSRNHAWQAVVKDRSNGSGCPYCSNNKLCKDNSLAVKYPAVAREWHPTKNGKKTPRGVTPRTSVKVWWLCAKGHSWEASIGHRTRGSGCPYCSNHKVCKDNSLAAKYPSVAQEWHPTKNRTLTPEMVLPGSMRKVWWLCKNGHEWFTAIQSRKNGGGCPRCPRPVNPAKSLAKRNPVLAAQWHPSKNGTLTPAKVYPHSSVKVWWLCKNGHEWSTAIQSRINGSGCPRCPRPVNSAKSLAKRNPGLAAQWHTSKNGSLTPADVTLFSCIKVWWKCKDKGHAWQAVIRDRALGKGCPKCRNLLKNRKKIYKK